MIIWSGSCPAHSEVHVDILSTPTVAPGLNERLTKRRQDCGADSVQHSLKRVQQGLEWGRWEGQERNGAIKVIV